MVSFTELRDQVEQIVAGDLAEEVQLRYNKYAERHLVEQQLIENSFDTISNRALDLLRNSQEVVDQDQEADQDMLEIVRIVFALSLLYTEESDAQEKSSLAMKVTRILKKLKTHDILGRNRSLVHLTELFTAQNPFVGGK